jgi:hypothetical protein
MALLKLLWGLLKMLAFVAVVLVINLFAIGMAKARYPDDEDRQNRFIVLEFAILLALILACHYITEAVLH